MIDYKQSAKLNGTDIDKLKAHFKKYLQSNKRIIAICDICQKEREVSFYAYRSLCQKCSVNTPEYRKRQSETTIEQFSTQESRDIASTKRIQYYIDYPKFALDHSKTLKNSLSMKIAIENMKGGLDLVWHHVAYDFNDPEGLRVRITRKFHGHIHNPSGVQFNKHGYSLID